MFWGVQLEGMVSKLFLKASNLDLDVPVGHGRVLQDLQQASSTEQPNVQVTHKVPEAKCPAKTAGVDPADRVKLFVRAAEVDTPADLGPVRDFQQAYAEQPKARATYKVSLSKIPAQAALSDPLERLRLFKEASGQQLDQAEAAGKAAVEKVRQLQSGLRQLQPMLSNDSSSSSQRHLSRRSRLRLGTRILRRLLWQRSSHLPPKPAHVHG